MTAEHSMLPITCYLHRYNNIKYMILYESFADNIERLIGHRPTKEEFFEKYIVEIDDENNIKMSPRIPLDNKIPHYKIKVKINQTIPLKIDGAECKLGLKYTIPSIPK